MWQKLGLKVLYSLASNLGSKLNILLRGKTFQNHFNFNRWLAARIKNFTGVYPFNAGRILLIYGGFSSNRLAKLRAMLDKLRI